MGITLSPHLLSTYYETVLRPFLVTNLTVYASHLLHTPYPKPFTLKMCPPMIPHLILKTHKWPELSPLQPHSTLHVGGSISKPSCLVFYGHWLCTYWVPDPTYPGCFLRITSHFTDEETEAGNSKAALPRACGKTQDLNPGSAVVQGLS